MTEDNVRDIHNPGAIRKWADEAQFEAAPMASDNRLPRVHLLSMTHDPLGAIAAACRMYEGKPTYNLADVTDAERASYWEDSLKTHLKAPHEFVDLHFFIEFVDRDFTHQMVRQRTAVFAQESLRFAVKESLSADSTLPPSLAGTQSMEDRGRRLGTYEKKADEWRDAWDDALDHIEDAYNFLVNSGMPAEDARGLLPGATATRLHYKTNLRNLAEHAGNRLCTQAQFHWRIVFAQIVEAIRNYSWCGRCQRDAHEKCLDRGGDNNCGCNCWSEPSSTAWQFETIAKSPIFRPACYQQGRCPFKAGFDRGCTIRDRVDRFATYGVPSSEWDKGFSPGSVIDPIPPINSVEWLLNPDAGRTTHDNRPS